MATLIKKNHIVTDQGYSGKVLYSAAELKEIWPQRINRTFEDACGIAIDSREVRPKQIFFGLGGKNFNGSDFAEEALANGASLCIINKINDRTASDERVMLVDDPLYELNKIAAFARKRMKGILIGVTGSVGKTTVKEMLRTSLENQGELYASRSSFNNHIGLPLSLANIHADTEFAVIEMGMNHAGELRALSKLAMPDINIITTVAAVHLEHFSSVSAIADAKSEVFEGMHANGIAVLNFDNPYYKILEAKAIEQKLQIITFGQQRSCSAYLADYKLIDGIAHISAEILGVNYEYMLGIAGKHMALNSIAVLAAVKLAGAEVEFAARSLREFQAVKGRGKIHHLGAKVLLDESYNASPIAVQAALENLARYKNTNRRLVAILGDMKELGRSSIALHVDLAKYIEKHQIDTVITVGELMKNLSQALPSSIALKHFTDADELRIEVASLIQDGDVILVKGSLSMQMEKIVNEIININNG